MLNRSTTLATLFFCGSIAVIASQVALPGLLASHVKAMESAPSLTATLNIQPLPGTAKSIKFSYSKPNLMKVETEEGFTLCDGKDVYTYTKSTNTYTVEPVTDAVIAEKVGGDETWAWASFFNREAFKNADAAKMGAKRTVKGTKVTEVNVTWQKPLAGQATIYFEDSGVIKGYSIKNGDKENLIMVEELVVGKEAADAGQFAFAAPTDSKKVEAMAPKAGFAGVLAILGKNCMPCHNAQNKKDGIDLSTYESITGNNAAVVAGDPEHSGIYNTTAGPHWSMPKGRAKLSKADTDAIQAWIKDGAKKD